MVDIVAFVDVGYLLFSALILAQQALAVVVEVTQVPYVSSPADIVTTLTEDFLMFFVSTWLP